MESTFPFFLAAGARQDLLLSAYPDSHTVPAARVRGLIYAISLPRRKEMAKEKTPKAAAFGNRSSRRFTTNGGFFATPKFLHLRGIYPTPQMGLQEPRFLALPFLFEICDFPWREAGRGRRISRLKLSKTTRGKL